MVGVSTNVIISAVLMQEFDLQVAYLEAEDLAKKLGGQFTGLGIFTLQAGSIFNYYNCLNFILDISHANELHQGLAIALKTNTRAIRFVMVPVPAQLEAQKPKTQVGVN